MGVFLVRIREGKKCPLHRKKVSGRASRDERDRSFWGHVLQKRWRTRFRTARLSDCRFLFLLIQQDSYSSQGPLTCCVLICFPSFFVRLDQWA